MIKVLIGDIFQSKATTLVNTVNCVGIMGKGIAKGFKDKYPQMYKDYLNQCKAGQVKLGQPFLYKDIFDTSIINFPTKDHWRSTSRLTDVFIGLDLFVQKYKEWGITSIAFPPLGCGNGGLEWSDVGKIMYQKLKDLDISIEIYAPYGTNQKELTDEFLNNSNSNIDSFKGKKYSKYNPNWVAILEVVNRLSTYKYAKPVGRTVFQKICYTMTSNGLDTGFQFKQGSYGPFSSQVKELLSVFANANIIYEEQLGQMLALRVTSEFEAIRKKYKSDIIKAETVISKTVDLFSRIKSTDQAEEVVTVLYANNKIFEQYPNKEISERQIFDYIYEWKKSWRSEDKQEAITSAIRNLEMLNWINLQYSDNLPYNSSTFDYN